MDIYFRDIIIGHYYDYTLGYINDHIHTNILSHVYDDVPDDDEHVTIDFNDNDSIQINKMLMTMKISPMMTMTPTLARPPTPC